MNLQDHIHNWEACNLCNLCTQRKQVVIGRGVVPCDVFFIGEAPGASENVLGKAFVGPAGHLLDRQIEQAGGGAYKQGFTNLVGCIPLGEDGSKTSEPPEESILACAPRVLELLELAQPKLIVLVGLLCEKWVPKILENAYGRVETREGKAGAGTVKSGKTRPLLSSRKPPMAAQPAADQYSLCLVPRIAITHPAAILRMDISRKGLEYQRVVVTLSDAFERFLT